MIKKIITFFVSLILCILIAEFFLRFMGHDPWKYISINNSFSDKKIYKKDTVLGWISTEDSYKFSPAHPKGEIFKLNIIKDGTRKTFSNNKNITDEILIIGGSFVMGWGVNDNETFSSKMDKKFSNIKVYNYGHGGYGTIQSLLLLEKEIANAKSAKIVVYGLIEHHEYRNAARTQWLRTLSTYSKSGAVETPYGYIGENNKLIIKPPIGYLNFRYKEKSSLITLVEKAYAKNMSNDEFPRDSIRKKQQKNITQQAIIKMKEISNNHNAHFVILSLDWNNSYTKNQYEIFFKKNNILFVDCSIPLIDEMVLLGDYHPSKKAHSYYGECLSNYIIKKNLLN